MTGPSLRRRIVVTCALTITLALAGMAAAAFLVVRHELYRSLDLELGRQVTAVRSGHGSSGQCQYLVEAACVQTLDSSGTVLSPADIRLPIDAGARAVASGAQATSSVDITVGAFRYRVRTEPLRPEGAVQVALRTDKIDASLHRLALALGLTTLIGMAIAIAAVLAAARAGLRPLSALTRTAEQVAVTANPDQRIEVSGRDEIARLGRSFNTMLAALRSAMDAQRRFVADASHELRTPLTALRTNVDLLDRLSPADRAATITTLRGQASELTGLVTDLIELARSDDPQAPPDESEPINVDQLVHRCVRTAQRSWPAITFDTDLTPTEWIGVAPRLARAISNLLDNAAKFSPAGSAVRITLRGGELTVRDHGPGIPAESLPHVFDRFYRAVQARDYPGSGIGLAIVKQVADAMGATVTVESPATGGTLVRWSRS
ncbi:sensor histidine kinase [Pseudonocardiaceae bacterium YIM PH 21723]|nr:sensor histidine kinase [Pseudonocardiaceae bacterium YIM PH 21723]